MKKLFTLALASIMLFSCSKEEIWTAQETGQMTINVEQGASVFVENQTTKTGTGEGETYTETTINVNSFYLKIVKSDANSSLYDGNVSGFNGPMVCSTGTYTATAENINETAAVSGRGAIRLYGTATGKVEANQTLSLELKCAMVNSKVTFAYADSFKSAFTVDENTNISVTRTAAIGETPAVNVEWDKDATHEDQAAYFTPGNYNYTITTKKDGNTMTYTGDISLSAKTWHKFTIIANTENGELGITLNVDKTMAVKPSNIEVNPYPGQNQD